MKSITLFEEDGWSFGLDPDDKTKAIAKLFYELAEKIADYSVFSLPWASVTEAMIDRLDVDSEDSVTVRFGVTAEFRDISSFCKACENSSDEEPESEFLEQVVSSIQSIRKYN